MGFTDQVALVGNGFEVHDPQGNLLTPFVVTDDNNVFRFQLDPPLAGGVVVVDYHIRAIDGDEQQGSFSFTVAAPLPTSTTAPPTISATGDDRTDEFTVDDRWRHDDAAGDRSHDGRVDVADRVAPRRSTLPGDGAGDSERNLMFAVLIGIAALAAGFLVIRSRRTA